MLRYEERNGSLYLMEGNEVIAEITDPVVLFDKDTFTQHKIGNRETVQAYYDEVYNKSEEARELVSSWRVLDLPKDAELMNKFLGSIDYARVYLDGVEVE